MCGEIGAKTLFEMFDIPHYLKRDDVYFQPHYGALMDVSH
jgi:hypothetical protein